MNAVIDIGSNSVRLLLSYEKKVSKKQTHTTQLARSLAKTGLLLFEKIEETANAVSDFCIEAKRLNAENIYIFATEATRASKNGFVLTNLIKQKTGIEVDVVDGKTEAKLGYMGACQGEENSAVIDVGGASVELIKDDKYLLSLPLGVVRTQEVVGNDRQNIEDYYKKEITAFDKIDCKKLIGIGGTATSIASMILNQEVYDPHAIHGLCITLAQIKELENHVFSGIDIVLKYKTISEKRAKVIPHGIILYRLMMEYLNKSELYISEFDNLEGYLILKNKF